MTTPLTVLMTAYDREAFVEAALRSVLASTFTDFRLLVVDDASQDTTVARARQVAQEDARVQVVENAVNLGDYANRNRALALVRTPFVKYHDSDDLMYPHGLGLMMEALASEPRAAFALSGSRYWPGGPCPRLSTPAQSYAREFLGSGMFHLGPAAALFRTEALRSLGGWPEEGGASDTLFWLRACRQMNVVLVSADLFYYRVHSGQELQSAEFRSSQRRATGQSWRSLKEASCPLAGSELRQARVNALWNVLRLARRDLARGRFGAAWDWLRQAGIKPADLLRYLRRPRRDPVAGA